jgi:hypothetical protein
MTSSNLTAINPITAAFEALAKNTADRKAYDFLVENYDADLIKSELINFSKNYLLSTVQSEIEASKKYKRKLSTFEDLLKYLLKNICSKDQLRPAMCKVYNDQKNGNLVATDAHILAWLPLQNLPINDSLDNICKEDLQDYYKIYSYSENSFKLDKYGDIVNEDMDNRYPDYKAVFPEANLLDYPYFSINPYLFNGLKTISKIAKKLKINILMVKLNCLEYNTYLNISLLVRYIDLHQKLYGNYTFLALTRNGYEEGRALYNVDISGKYKLLLMTCIKSDEENILDLDL